MNLITVQEKIKRNTNRRSAADDILALGAIESVCRRYYRRKFRFNVKTVGMKLNGERTDRSPDGNLTGGVDPDFIYYFPWDLLRSIRMTRLPPNNKRQIIEWSLTTLLRSYNYEQPGTPSGFAWDGDSTIVVRPIPEPAYDVELQYLADVNRPEQVWVDGDWILVDSITGLKFDDDTTSPWFDEAQDLVVWAAVNELCMGPYGDQERGSRAGMMESRALRDLERFDGMTQQARSAKAYY